MNQHGWQIKREKNSVLKTFEQFNLINLRIAAEANLHVDC